MDKLRFVHSTYIGNMEQVYRSVAHDVYAKYIESGLVKPEREQAVVDACIQHLAMLNVKVKFAK